ncbi:DUF7009 family protein [Flavilitoribacter nigricans]|uniref:Uncharacterized protein n=1 Tax=Flavilitoribacter nigricans (strain ATCC 23147 / DSM 23189 / NBRC 102662 / NCIMB 1420 / SS-2) TaxID=1122177 RepID=A0A2D0NIL2_FLAN2|nr:hypothetical protein [Flavilitoribacter nigricans]PHN07593.1 hypothetical protein CRP01_05690 [Flavilitoribacter nigricans DSM 23189 = NBRC 102662]
MKIRIKGNTLRLRLSQTEIKQLDEAGMVSEAIAFGPGQTLVYSLERSDAAESPRAVYSDHRILVILPEKAVRDWVQSDQVSIVGEQNNATSEGLSLLIEKDFRCLTERAHEDEEDLFPHPKEGEINC